MRYFSRAQEAAYASRFSLVDAKLQGLPPVTITRAPIDPLQSDGVMLEGALKKALKVSFAK